MTFLKWEHYSGKRCQRSITHFVTGQAYTAAGKIMGTFLSQNAEVPTQVTPKSRSGKNPQMFLIISNHYDASQINIKVTLLSLCGVTSVRAERSFTTKIVHIFLISISSRPICLRLPDISPRLLILSFCCILFLCVKDSVTRTLFL